MPITVTRDEVDSHRPFVYAREEADGRFTLYFAGDVIPPIPQPPAAPCPAAVSATGLRLALIEAGMQNAIEAYVPTQPPETKVWWEYQVTMRRDHPLIAKAQADLGIADAVADMLFNRAEQLAPL